MCFIKNSSHQIDCINLSSVGETFLYCPQENIERGHLINSAKPRSFLL